MNEPRPGHQAEFLQRDEDVVLWVAGEGECLPGERLDFLAHRSLLLDWAKHINTPDARGCYAGHSAGVGVMFQDSAARMDSSVARLIWPSGATLDFSMQGREFDWIGVDHAETLEIESVLALMSRSRRGSLRMVSRGMPAWLDPGTRDGRIAVVETEEQVEVPHPARARTVEMAMDVEAWLDDMAKVNAGRANTPTAQARDFLATAILSCPPSTFETVTSRRLAAAADGPTFALVGAP